MDSSLINAVLGAADKLVHIKFKSMEENIECGDFVFYNNFDSANLANVEKVEINKADYGKSENNKSHKSLNEFPNYEFNIWTKHDCHGTEFQNNNKTWFYFGVKAAVPGAYVKLNLVNLNKQVKMFSQGMSPVYKVIPGHPQWERIKEKPTFTADDKKNEFLLSFNFRTPDNHNAITYFAFTYPFSYTDLQNYLKKIDIKLANFSRSEADDIYYHRECAIKSLEGRRLDVLTISSYYNILPIREAKIKDLFPEENEQRPFQFQNKKVIFLSARVHPGETPSSFVLNGFLNFLLNRDDQIAITLRRLYVFKLIPMLNPDGVAQGFYRMDTKGVNLNRLYLNPSIVDHPTIYAANLLIRYYHNSYSLSEVEGETIHDKVPEVPKSFDRSVEKSLVSNSFNTISSINSISDETCKLLQRVTLMSIEEKHKYMEQGSRVRNYLASEKCILKNQDSLENEDTAIESTENLCSGGDMKEISKNPESSGIFLYIDFHGHASKKGIFMYGNYFDNPDDSADCMLLPKLMSINNQNFHFTSCNFAEKNMYLIDKRDGMSREGSGRVAVYKLTGLIYSYTLECNYNTGRLVNTVPARVKEGVRKNRGQLFVPPKYNPTVFEQVGAALGPSILDMTGSNPNSRLPNSQYRSLKGLKSYLKLISSNQYQTTLNKPLHKNCTGDQLRKSQEMPGGEVGHEKPLRAFTKRSTPKSIASIEKTVCKLLAAANIFSAMKKIRASKRPRLPPERKCPKKKVIVPKIISTHVRIKPKPLPSMHSGRKASHKVSHKASHKASRKPNHKGGHKLSPRAPSTAAPSFKPSCFVKLQVAKKKASQKLAKTARKLQPESGDGTKRSVASSSNNKSKSAYSKVRTKNKRSAKSERKYRKRSFIS